MKNLRTELALNKTIAVETTYIRCTTRSHKTYTKAGRYYTQVVTDYSYYFYMTGREMSKLY